MSTRILTKGALVRRLIALPRKETEKQQRLRLNECDTFEWPQKLWKQATIFLSKITLFLVVLYGIITFGGLSGIDNLAAVDVIYLISASLTTVGLGDVAPSAMLSRLTAIFLLPFGMIVVSLVISLFAAHSNSMTVAPLARNAADDDPIQKLIRKTSMVSQTIVRRIHAVKHQSTVSTICVCLGQYLLILLVGCSYFLFCFGDRMFDHTELGEKLTFIDALYFSSVVSTTVGYGRHFYANSNSAKWFLTFYFLFSTFVVASILAELSGLYLDHQENKILKKIFNSSADVYKTDLDDNKEVDESDFVLFKLLQLQKVHTRTLEKLIRRFDELDVDNKGYLQVGVDIPSEEQSIDLTKRAHAHHTTESHVWHENQSTYATAYKHHNPEKFEQLRYLNGFTAVKSNRCDDFRFSRDLWTSAMFKLCKLSLLVLLCYSLFGALVSYLEGFSWINGAYFLSTTISTVGFGDFVPTTQLTRGLAIVLLPLGLVLIGMIMSIFAAQKLAYSVVIPNIDVHLAQWVKFPLLLLELYLVITPCALFMWWCPGEGLGWVDAFYFATVTATTVGYGDITPSTDKAKIALALYMPIATLWLGNVVRKLSKLILAFVEKRINSVIIESPTALYKADILRTGFLDETDYILFKLQQMQQVDTDILDRVLDLFDELDIKKTGFLRIGVDIPSKQQQETILAQCDGDVLSQSFNNMWVKQRDEIRAARPMGRTLDALGGRRRIDRDLYKRSAKIKSEFTLSSIPSASSLDSDVTALEFPSDLSGSEKSPTGAQEADQVERGVKTRKSVSIQELEEVYIEDPPKLKTRIVSLDEAIAVSIREKEKPPPLLHKPSVKRDHKEESAEVFSLGAPLEMPASLKKSLSSARSLSKKWLD